MKISRRSSSPYSQHYTNDEADFQRYIRAVEAHQVCGIIEIFHAPLFYLQLKWGDDAILRLHDALNVGGSGT